MINSFMKKIPISLSLMFLTTLLPMIPQEKVLKDIFDPGMIKVHNDELIVVEGAVVYIFSLPDVSYKLSFGKKGEGPGEMTSFPYIYNRSISFSNAYFVDSQEKVLYFSKDGIFIREKKKPIGVSNIEPVERNFVGSKLSIIEGKTQYQAIVLYDEKFEVIKELAREVSPAQSVKATTELPLDPLNYAVYKDQIYVERSREGFLIEVYNSEGKLTREIRKETKRKSIGRKEKKKLLADFKNDSSIKAFGFENVVQMTKLTYPESLPAITGLVIADSKLYIKTSQQYVDPTEFIVLDLEGKELGHFQVSGLTETPYVAHLSNVNVKYHTISQGKLYYLTFGEEETKLRIHTIDMK